MKNAGLFGLMKSKRILQVIATLSAGGAEGFIANLSRDMANSGNEVVVYLLAGVQGERGDVLHQLLQTAGVRVLGADRRKAASLHNLTQLCRIIREFKPDVIQANLDSSEVACLAARILLFDRKTVYIRRLANSKLFRSRFGRFCFDFRGFAYDGTVACSNAVFVEAKKYSILSRSRLIAEIPNGADLRNGSVMAYNRTSSRRELDVAESAFVVAHIGSFNSGKLGIPGLSGSQKSQDVVILAFSEFAKANADSLLLLAGDGPLRAEAEELANKLCIRSRVRFLGIEREPWRLLRAADVFIFPSRYEGHPNVLPEAGASGLPVVASEIPENRAIYSGFPWIFCNVDDVSGFASAISTVRNNLNRFKSAASDSANVFVQRFDMKQCSSQYLSFYETVRQHSV